MIFEMSTFTGLKRIKLCQSQTHFHGYTSFSSSAVYVRPTKISF